MKMSRTFLAGFLITLISAWATGLVGEIEPSNTTQYLNSIKDWQAKRLEDLKSDDSWLSLAGLFWLQEGKNTFGSDKKNSMIITDVKAPPHIGSFILHAGQVRFKVRSETPVHCEGKPVTELVMANDSTRNPTILTSGTLSWFVIKRGTRQGIRLKDSQNPRIRKLKEIKTFPIAMDWRVPAKLIRFDKPRMIETPTVIGTMVEQPSPGKLVFKIKNKTYTLTPMGGDGDLFIIFGDRTNGNQTYGGGRFLTVKKPDSKGQTIIDFNRSYNPPCVFTPFATCPLPPLKNKLPIAVKAGEKMVHDLGVH